MPAEGLSHLRYLDGMKQCMRCREIKEAEYFRAGQAYWAEWCMKCEATPSGKIPKMGN